MVANLCLTIKCVASPKMVAPTGSLSVFVRGEQAARHPPNTHPSQCLCKNGECGETPPRLGVRNSSRGPSWWGFVKSGLHNNVCCQAS